jgi:hypothetical protein
VRYLSAVGDERAYEEHAWIIPFGMGLFFAFSMTATLISPVILTGAEGAVMSLTGSTFSQLAASSPGVANYIYYLIRIFAIFSAGLGVLFAVVSATAYRRGEPWSWFVTWIVPVLFVLDFADDYFSFRYVDTSSIVIAAILVAGLLLPYRKFFPVGRPRSAS